MSSPLKENFRHNGWVIFNHDSTLLKWTQHALPACREAVSATRNMQWLRHNGTWFVGVNALDNDRNGRLTDGPPFDGPFIPFLDQQLDLRDIEWDAAQVSVLYPHYPGYSGDESEAAHRYRQKRDAAHIDGLLRVGQQKRRFLREHHAFILGIPMVEFSAGASPFVVWRGSHRIAKVVFEKRLANVDPERWHEIDLTDTYHALRSRIFEHCERIVLHLKPGQCFLAHRLCLHGMAPWQAEATASADGRMMCYFRPALQRIEDWLFRA